MQNLGETMPKVSNGQQLVEWEGVFAEGNYSPNTSPLSSVQLHSMKNKSALGGIQACRLQAQLALKVPGRGPSRARWAQRGNQRLTMHFGVTSESALSSRHSMRRFVAVVWKRDRWRQVP